jgi:ribosome biogenesis SPOUT family RNA methylase Rps3
MGMKIYIEHLERDLGRWILAEYRSSYRLAGEMLTITGIEIPGLPSTRKRFYELVEPLKAIILDPQAPEELKPEDLRGYEAIVIGGILGAHPPLGRTKKLLSERFPEAAKRNIGEHPFPIDASVYMALEVIRGKRIEEIPVALGLIIRKRIGNIEHEIELPYAYPIVNNKPLISEEVLQIIVGRGEYELIFNPVPAI